jgi:hypothetical protein
MTKLDKGGCWLESNNAGFATGANSPSRTTRFIRFNAAVNVTKYSPPPKPEIRSVVADNGNRINFF